MRHAFSLVELSIVLVILGLLTGGILAGKSLIRAAQLRKYQTELTRYETAYNSFLERYNARPGDMADAESLWGRMAMCPANANPVVATGVCNGDDNRALDTIREAGNTFAMLSRAGLIEGDYLYNDGPGVTETLMRGTVFAPGPEDSTFTYRHSDIHGTMRNYLHVGAFQSGAGGYTKGMFTATEAWSIDNKMDDGIAGTGRWIGEREWCNLGGACPGSAGRCASLHISTVTSVDSVYNLDVTQQKCNMNVLVN